MKRISVLLLLVSLLGGLLSACRARQSAQPTVTLAPTLPPPPTATRTPLPTPTPPPTPIPSPTPTLAPSPTPFVPFDAAAVVDNVNLRENPGYLFKVLAKVEQGTPLKVTGRSPGGEWILVQAPNDAAGLGLQPAPGAGQGLRGCPAGPAAERPAPAGQGGRSAGEPGQRHPVHDPPRRRDEPNPQRRHDRRRRQFLRLHAARLRRHLAGRLYRHRLHQQPDGRELQQQERGFRQRRPAGGHHQLAAQRSAGLYLEVTPNRGLGS